jgi:flagellar motility protein MotE (MotC chaperone)
MQQYKLMKSILAAKVILIVSALALHQGWIRIGDLPVVAANESVKEKGGKEDGKEDGKEGGEKKGEPKPAEERATSPQDAVKMKDENEAKKEDATRKSFLSDLFTLPKLNAKKAQKEEIGKYLDLAERKERQVEQRTSQLAKREEQLKALEKSIEDKLVKMDEERKFIAKTLQQEKDLKGERIDKIAELFDKMEPKKAAPAFEKLDKDLTVALFKKLKQKQITTILETMSPEKSVELTEYFARVKSAREYDMLKELNESLRKEFQDCKGMVPVASAAQPAAEKDAKTDAKVDQTDDAKADGKTETKK